MSSAVFLHDDTVLTVDATGPQLRRRDSEVAHRLSIGEALALGLLGHTGEEAVASAMLSEVIGDSSGPSWVAQVINRFPTYFGGTTKRVLDAALFDRIDRSRYVVPEPLRREAAPASVSWLVTLACNRKCPYCYFNVTAWQESNPQSPPDARFSLPSALRMVGEMGKLGTADLFLTGGEPLLRKDLVQIIAAGSKERIRVHVNTKFHITRELAHSLADAGLHEMSFSLDDARPLVANGLAGSADFHAQAMSSIAAAVSAGLNLRVNTVVNPLNRERLDDLAALLESMGVRRLTLSPLVDPKPFRRIARKLVGSGPSVRSIVRSLQPRHPQLVIDVGSGETFAPASAAGGDRHLCEVGIRSIDVLPDGKVTRCRYVPDAAELIIGDLERQSIMDVWNGAALAGFNEPARADFAGSACESCGGFSRCNERGRCVASAIATQGRWSAPDSGCTA